MPKLLILPGAFDALGGTLITLGLLIKGLCDQGVDPCVVVKAESLMESYLERLGQTAYLHRIKAKNSAEFIYKAVAWVNQQPLDWPLLLDNCVERDLLSGLIGAAPGLRLSGRSLFHFCHDLALSYNPVGFWSRKLAFSLLAPGAICNSNFTASHIRRLIPNLRGVLYQPVDCTQFNPQPVAEVPSPLQTIRQAGFRITLTPSRINQAGIVNDKNLRGLIPVLATLKKQGYKYHSVVIGQDNSPGQTNSQALRDAANQAGVGDRFTLLPPSLAIQDYFKAADVVITLAPREPFGRVVVEAIACGVPVVGSRTGGIGEILNYFAPNWTVDPDNPIETAEAILRVMDDPNTPQLLAQGQSWVEEHCSVTRYAQEMIRLTGLTITPDSTFNSKLSPASTPMTKDSFA
jgi:glycosyltransferase involved in cell wall biosynthesis